MTGAVVIMTCDKYLPFWEGMYHYMRKYWDFSIPWPIYFCNEFIPVTFADPNFRHLPVGPGPFHERQIRILDALQEYDYIFFMLEEYWPIRPMTKDMFMGLHDLMVRNDWDCLHVDSVLPEYYKLEQTPHIFQGRRLLKFQKDSDWRFSQQARFWKRELLRNCIVAPEISEVEVSTSLTVEMACDKHMRLYYPDATVMLYHYWWYPRFGAAWRGKLSPMGEELMIHMKIDQWCEQQYEIEKSQS